MCGIFGIVFRQGPVDPALLDRATDAVAHRGPDGRGTWISGAVGLGHRRLSILDLSEAGRQPMRHAEAPLTIVYNGEIYNYLELRAELAALGHRFRTGTDTEVILAAYLAWGESCVERFNGMWAFGLHDERRQRLFCSRDRFGVKPLYWIDTPGAFAFGSEMRQLIPLLPSRRARAGALHDFLASGLSDHEEEGWLVGLRQVAPGANLVVELPGGRVRSTRHYEPRAAPIAPRSAADAAQSLRALLEDAVRLRLRSDVRVGTCLSGGLDSSSIATLAAGLQPAEAEPFRAVTAISETPENSEEPYARQVVASAGLEWTAVRPRADDFEAALEEVMQAQEAPVGGPSVAMQHFVMRAARAEGIKVLLDGQGADECWFGYERHAALWLQRASAAGPRMWWRAARGLLEHQGNIGPARLVGLALAPRLPGRAGAALVTRYPGARAPERLPAAWSAYLRDLDDPLAAQRRELQATSLPMLLRYADRSSMRHGVEVRLPFLDVRVVELSLATDVAHKFHEGWSKWPLRQALQGRLPAEVSWRRRKLGFEAPDGVWLPRIRPRMKDEVGRSELLGQLFEREPLLRGFDALQPGAAWRLFSIAVWERQQGVGGVA